MENISFQKVCEIAEVIQAQGSQVSIDLIVDSIYSELPNKGEIAQGEFGPKHRSLELLETIAAHLREWRRRQRQSRKTKLISSPSELFQAALEKELHRIVAQDRFDVSKDIEELEEDNRFLEKELMARRKLVNVNRAFLETIKRLEKENQILEEEKEVSKKETLQLQHRLGDQKEKSAAIIVKAREEQYTLKVDNETLKVQLDEAKNKIKVLEGQLAGLKAELDRRNEKIESFKKGKVLLQRDLSESKIRHQDLEEELKHLQKIESQIKSVMSGTPTPRSKVLPTPRANLDSNDSHENSSQLKASKKTLKHLKQEIQKNKISLNSSETENEMKKKAFDSKFI